MTVAAIPARDGIISSDPTAAAIAAGIAFHQWADFSWAPVFFGLLGRWTARLPPVALAAVALPWAFLTSPTEWFVLVLSFRSGSRSSRSSNPYWIGSGPPVVRRDLSTVRLAPLANRPCSVDHRGTFRAHIGRRGPLSYWPRRPPWVWRRRFLYRYL